jgi:hypothetical protein
VIEASYHVAAESTTGAEESDADALRKKRNLG